MQKIKYFHHQDELQVKVQSAVLKDFFELSLKAMNEVMKKKSLLKKRALKFATKFKKEIPGVEIIAIHFTQLLSGDFHDQEKEHEYRKEFMEGVRNTFNKLLTQFEIPQEIVKPVFRNDGYSNVALDLKDFVEEESIDMVVIGAQGQTPIQNFLFGSVTEGFVDQCDTIPVFVIR